ncbi:MAG TPA: hypothetical protein VGD37_37160 [Kofleriaceae bacterium]|jgi:hypothetical protein
MNVATVAGTFESERAMRSAPVLPVDVAGVRGGALVLSIVGLLIGLLLITAGCGPPN